MNHSNSRALLLEAARTVRYEGGDRWLSRELMRESANLGLLEMESLRSNSRKYGIAALDAAKDFVQCSDWPEVKNVLLMTQPVIEATGDEELITKLNELLLAADYWIADKAKNRKRHERHERRLRWRNQITKRPLRRVLEKHRATRVKQTGRWYGIHFRINERAAKAAATQQALCDSTQAG